MKNKKRSASEIGRASRSKGKVGEREAARELMKRISGSRIERSVQYAGRDASHGEGGMPDLIGMQGYHFEVKRTEKSQPYRWIEQVLKDKKTEEIGVILHRQNRKEWIVIMSIDDFCRLVNKAERSDK